MPTNPNIPRCRGCGAKLIAYSGSAKDWHANRKRKKLPTMTYNNQLPARGHGGDNIVCGNGCAYTLLMRLVASVPGVLDLVLPRPDLDPVEKNERQIAKAKAARESRALKKHIRNEAVIILDSFYSR